MASCDVKGTAFLIEELPTAPVSLPRQILDLHHPSALHGRQTVHQTWTSTIVLLHRRCFGKRTEFTRRSPWKALLQLMNSHSSLPFHIALRCRAKKASCFSGVGNISSPTAPTRVPLNKEGAAPIGRPQTIATRVYIGCPTAIRSQFRSSSSSSRRFYKNCSSPNLRDFGSGRLDHFRRNRIYRM